MNESSEGSASFGANAWLVDDMYEQYRQDPASVSESWREFFENYRPGGANLARPSTPEARLTADQAAPGSGPPAAPVAEAPRRPTAAPADGATGGSQPVALRGAAARVVANMTASLGVPTATSFRVVPARLLEVNRKILNNQLSRTGSAGKVSFTHLIGYAVVEALKAVPALNSSFAEPNPADPKPSPGVVHHDHLGLGIAVDVEKADGSRSLIVPVIKAADTMDFRDFWAAYEELIRKVRTNKIGADDLAGATVSLTNPGTLGTVQSVPRLMPGQGAIVGVGTIDFPAEWQAADERVLAELGVSKVVTVTSTYDHRIIQGAESGLFLRKVHELLTGGDHFYHRVFKAMGVPYEPVPFHRDVNDLSEGPGLQVRKQMEVDNLINMYRVRGHLIAHLDPLDWKDPHMHPELDPTTHGLSVWDLEREFLTNGLAGSERMKLADILGVLRDAYCRTVGVEYMYIQEPDQKRWIQQHVEGVSSQLDPAEQRWVLDRLNAAEALEQFLNTKFIGQKRFGLEGGESAIPLIDAVLDQAAVEGVEHAVLGMAHRGRLNVLINIVGKGYGELFGEFEGNIDPGTVQGSGDVKYHKGFRGRFTGRSGTPLDVVLSSNPSHLEAVDPVVEGMARALRDQLCKDHVPDKGNHPVVPLLIHGDAAFAGQGVVAETLNMSALPGYETGGTVHLVINNQLGFTTNPESSRSSVYATDVAKMVQAPIFHVNGDDPEACVRVGRLAFGFRQQFHKDVVIDMVCYRRFGHNEQDDPSLTQPLLYQLIKEHRSVRKLYTELLVRRGDIDLEQAEDVLKDFSGRLQAALDETRASAPPKPTSLPPVPEPAPLAPVIETGVPQPELEKIVSALATFPPGFVLHPKLVKVFDTRARLWESGEADWALGEALAYGTLLLEGRDVRLAGQDTRRGTFGHRNAAVVDYTTGTEYVPLGALGPGRFSIYDSLLSEYAALGFEYGYSLMGRDGLVAWEAQFGDFVNGAQIIIDQFLAAAEIKWGQTSGLVLLLPHGYEGQGAEHSSGRIERFLDLCAEDNMQVADVTTSSQLFHLLRRQVLRPTRKPLILFTPKRYLRARESYSTLSEFTEGHFREVLDDGAVADPERVRRVVLATGKVALDVIGARDQAARDDVAVVRVEQLHPWPLEQIVAAVSGYERASEIVWVQEEPANMGAANFVRDRLDEMFEADYQVLRVSRVASGSPATGSHAMHELEQADLLARALG
ncbi:MAG: multifunctional oxoglutarate decarboxylase/oxoglutarate dehydrogenase thiamine pyrophosphate-binding subunit/dihydrolipoyllysine-residue succinyltransferase subunit [Acidimicrobiales bacterium]|nr:multifunctional oxoglutarate decarboxylase/oxoglutarate dehydrogenase thiamine pyrophosphate-binding subunit/dihydrolipoyllysine-residue succinyltransferase subunit [Acidimicrobiales bacterium]